MEYLELKLFTYLLSVIIHPDWAIIKLEQAMPTP